MSIQQVELNKAYRLLQVGPTTMISAKKMMELKNVMAAARVGLIGNNKVMAFYRSTGIYSRACGKKADITLSRSQ